MSNAKKALITGITGQDGIPDGAAAGEGVSGAWDQAAREQLQYQRIDHLCRTRMKVTLAWCSITATSPTAPT